MNMKRILIRIYPEKQAHMHNVQHKNDHGTWYSVYRDIVEEKYHGAHQQQVNKLGFFVVCLILSLTNFPDSKLAQQNVIKNVQSCHYNQQDSQQK